MALEAGQYVKATDGTHVDTDGVKRYVALLSQSGTDAPAATVLENTLGGTVVWSYFDEGIYQGVLAGAFTTNKTACLLSNGATLTVIACTPNDADTIQVRATTDSQVNQATLEIRVYPA